MVAANKGTPSRKAFPAQLEAFAAFHRKHPDTMIYLHTSKGEHGENQGVNLPEICEYQGIQDAVVFCDQYMNMLGFPEEYMLYAYNAMDVFLNVGMGEGFGIPVLEAQACGTPVIVGDWTAMSELCFGGWKVELRDALPIWTPLAAYQFQPDRNAIVKALDKAYTMSGSP